MCKWHSYRWLSVAIIAIALTCAGVVSAQVTVNAPSGLTNRHSSSTTKKTEDKAKASQPTGKSEVKSSQESKEKHESAENNTTEKKQSTTSRKSAKDYSLSNQSVRKRAAGYRIQVYFSSSRQGRNEARSRAREVALKYPHYRTYISYVAPQWRLRIGDFKSKVEAQKALRKVKRSFPSFASDIILVTDNINVWTHD